MKTKIILSLLLFMLNIFQTNSSPQDSKLDTLYLQGKNIIKPSVKNIVTLINLEQSEFQSTIEGYGFKFVVVKSGFDLYDNGVDINNHGTETISKATAGKTIRIEWQDAHPTSIVKDLASELSQYHISTLESGNELYKFTLEGHLYKVLIGRDDEYEAVLAQKLN